MFYKTRQTFGTYSTDFYDPDSNLWVWNNSSMYYMSALVGLPYQVDSSIAYYPSGYLYNGYDYYVCGSLYLWRDTSYWYLTSYLGFGNIATMSYWRRYTSSGIAGTYTKTGTASVDKTVTLMPVIGRSSASLYGEYVPVTGSGLTENHRLGVRTYSSGGLILVETTEELNGEPVFHDSNLLLYYLWWSTDLSSWIISDELGVADETIGYWKRNDSEIAGEYDLIYTGSTPPTPSSYTLTGPTYSKGSNTELIYMAQVALWL